MLVTDFPEKGRTGGNGEALRPGMASHGADTWFVYQMVTLSDAGVNPAFHGARDAVPYGASP